MSIAFAFSKISTKTLSDHSQRVHHPVGQQNTTAFGEKCSVGVHLNIIQVHTQNVGHFTLAMSHFVLVMSYAPYCTVLIWLAYGMSFLPCISHTRWATKCSESRAIAQAQEEGHGGGYIAMTLTYKMATRKLKNLTQKVAKVKLFECNHHQNTQVKLPTCSLHNP